MLRSSKVISAIASTFMFCCATTANAVPVPLFTFTQTVTPATGNFHIGNEIQTGQALQVSAIGVYVTPAQITAGLTNVSYTARLFASDATTVLSSAAIPIGTPVDGQGFAYVPLNTTLSASTNYYLTSRATATNGTAYGYYNTGGFAGTWALGTTFIRNRYVAGFGNVNTTNGSFKEFMGGNLMVDVIPPPPAPEPSSMILFGTGLVGLAMQRRRRIQRLSMA